MVKRKVNSMDAQIQTFAEDLLIVDGPIAYDFGVPFSTRMIIAKLTDGSVWICDPIQVSTNTLNHIRTLGTVKYLVASTWRHVWRLKEGHRLFPEAELWSSRRIPRNCRELPFAGRLADEQTKGWAKDFDQIVFQGNPFLDEVLFIHKKSGTLIVGDLIQNHATKKRQPLRNALWKLAGVDNPHGGVPRDIRLTFTKRDQARQSLDQLLSLDFDKLIIGHGPCVEKDAKFVVKQAFHWLEK